MDNFDYLIYISILQFNKFSELHRENEDLQHQNRQLQRQLSTVEESNPNKNSNNAIDQSNSGTINELMR